MNFIYKFKNFMRERYGQDELSMFLFKIYIVILLLNLFIKSTIVFYIELFFLLIILLRFFSKNYYKRDKENKIFLRLKNKLINKTNKTNIYKRCHKCKTMLKLPLPSKIGIKKVRCPECKHLNRFIVLRKEKIEIIRNK